MFSGDQIVFLTDLIELELVLRDHGSDAAACKAVGCIEEMLGNMGYDPFLCFLGLHRSEAIQYLAIEGSDPQLKVIGKAFDMATAQKIMEIGETLEKYVHKACSGSVPAGSAAWWREMRPKLKATRTADGTPLHAFILATLKANRIAP